MRIATWNVNSMRARLDRVVAWVGHNDLDVVALARGMGVPGRAVANVDDFVKALAEAVAEPGPRLIEVQL